MSIAVDKTERRIVPRLRDTAAAVAFGEISPLGVALESKGPSPEALVGLEQRIREWQRSESWPFASDAMGTAIVLGHTADVQDAARFVLEKARDVPPLVARMAHSVLAASEEGDTDRPGIVAVPTPGRQIAALRARIRSYPANALTWLDLAQAYALAAQNDQALRAMSAAVGLLPDHRLILRSAARLFVHVREYDRALWHLRKSAATRSDPWLIAAEIAVADTAGVRTELASVGRRMAMSDQIAPFHLSELRSAVGTKEYESGGSRRARQLLRNSLEDPTENAVAQAEWLSSVKLVSLPLDDAMLGSSMEAKATDAFARQEWRRAFDLGLGWFGEQPWSSQAVMLVSHMAATTGQWFDEALPVLQFGVRSNPKEWPILNNLAFCQVMDGRLDDAALTLAGSTRYAGDNVSAGFFAATSGLLAYRSGSIEEGRRLYQAALDLFSAASGDQRENRASAAVHWAQEESRLGEGSRHDVIGMAHDLAERVKRPYIDEIVRRVEANLAIGG